MQGNTMVSKMGSSILISSQQSNTIVDSFQNYKSTCLIINSKPKAQVHQTISDNENVSKALLHSICAK
jgi:hypothetical protein